MVVVVVVVVVVTAAATAAYRNTEIGHEFVDWILVAHYTDKREFYEHISKSTQFQYSW